MKTAKGSTWAAMGKRSEVKTGIGFRLLAGGVFGKADPGLHTHGD